MPVTRIEDFGTLPDGTPVPRFVLDNGNGLKAEVIALGGIVTKLIVPDRAGHAANVLLSPASVRQILENKTPYLGALIGRFGNRIGGATFSLDGTTYHLAANNGRASLHGGVVGYDKRLWTITPVAGKTALTLSLVDAVGTEGYPGTVTVDVTYTLTDDNAWQIDYAATTDAPTPINLTQHAYFNLKDAGKTKITDHVVRLYASAYTPSGPDLVPDGGLAPVEGTPLDYRTPKAAGADFARLTTVPVGVDDNFVIDGADGSLRPAAEVAEPTTGRTLTVLTTEPGIQFYTGNFLDGSLVGQDGFAFEQHTGFCLETQHFPNSPNVPDYPSTILRPGETYRTTTVYRFGVK